MSKKMKIRLGDLKRLIETRLNEEDQESPKPFTPKPQKSEIGDSIDSQIDRFLSEYESEARNSKNEGMDYRLMIRRMIREENEDQAEVDDSISGEKKTLEEIDVESFANSVSRLIENFENLVETRNAILRRAINFLLDSYDDSVKESFEESMEQQHGISLEKSKVDVQNDFETPAADRAGPELPGSGGGGAV